MLTIDIVSKNAQNKEKLKYLKKEPKEWENWKRIFVVVQGVRFKSGMKKIWSYSLTKRLVENVKTVLESWVIGLQNMSSMT